MERRSTTFMRDRRDRGATRRARRRPGARERGVDGGPHPRGVLAGTPRSSPSESALVAEKVRYARSISAGDPFGYSLKLFFFGCVVVAGLHGAATASRAILFI